jgi:hypothetical protein
MKNRRMRAERKTEEGNLRSGPRLFHYNFPPLIVSKVFFESVRAIFRRGLGEGEAFGT